MIRSSEVWIGVVSHRHGTNIYAGTTQRAVKQQVFDYVSDYWHEVHSLDDDEPPAHDMDGAIEAYFEQREEEWYELDCIPVFAED